jgi:hypothetical protein
MAVGHELAPLIPNRMQIGVTDSTEEDLDLNVMLLEIPSLNGGACKR